MSCENFFQTYIGALCDPAATTVYDYAPTLSEVFNDETCQKIESRSNAVLIRDDDCRLIVQGSDYLHVILALSIVEDIVARFETNFSYPSMHNSSAMLDKVLERAYSHDDESGDGRDWSAMPEEVKQAFIVSLMDSDVSESTVTGVIDITDEQDEDEEPVAAAAAASTDVGSIVLSSHAAAAASTHDTLSSATLQNVVESPPRLDISDTSVQPIVRLAVSKGYSEDEIKSVLSNTVQLKESEFLRSLHTNRRLQLATSRQPSVDNSTSLQQVVVSSGQPVAAADNNSSVHTFGQSSICSIAGPKDVYLQRVDRASSNVANVDDLGRRDERDSCMDLDELNAELLMEAVDDSVICLKSDHEMHSSDDGSEIVLEFNTDADARLIEIAEQSRLPKEFVVLSEQRPENSSTAGSGASSGKKRRKKTKKKKNLLPDKTVVHTEKLTNAVTARNDMNELDCISLIPGGQSTAAAAADQSSNVVNVSDNNDSDSDVMIEAPENAEGWRTVDGRKDRHHLTHQNDQWNHPIHVQPAGSVNNGVYKNNNYQNPRQFDFPVSGSNSVPTSDTGI